MAGAAFGRGDVPVGGELDRAVRDLDLQGRAGEAHRGQETRGCRQQRRTERRHGGAAAPAPDERGEGREGGAEREDDDCGLQDHGGLANGSLHIGFGVTVPTLPRQGGASIEIAARCLTAAGLLIPLGFFLGGLFTHGADPGLGALLVPPGAVLLFVAVGLTARALRAGARAPRG
jgi:hypothetical protein